MGELANVATENDVDYRLIINHSGFLSPKLELQLLCAKMQVTPILDRVKADKGSLTPGGVAVAARIARIGYATEPETEGTKVVFSGHGRCVEMLISGTRHS